MKRKLNIVMRIFLFCLVSFTNVSFSQTIPTLDIIGESNVLLNDVETYNAFSGTTTIYSGTWSVKGGVIQSQSPTSATILWNTVGAKTLKLDVTSSSNGAMQASKVITVNGTAAPVTPPNPIISNQNCTIATLQKSTNPPSGVEWYWQGTNSNGTSTTNNAITNYSANSSGTYYIRARNIGDGTWSLGSGSISVTLGSIGGTIWYADTDGDGLGDPNSYVTQCTAPNGYVANNNDQCPSTHGNGSFTGCPFSFALSNENYIHTISPQIAVTEIYENIYTNQRDQFIENVTYFDGLGRAKQNVGIRQGLANKDIVTHIEYDEFGRQEKEYLPYVSLETNGFIKNDALSETNLFYLQPKYENTQNPYSKKKFENSPLNRIIEQGAPGNDWKITSNSLPKGYSDGHTIKFEYDTNINNEVKMFSVTSTLSGNIYNPTLTGGTFYPEGKLIKTITKDENWKQSDGLKRTIEEFKDFNGNVILKRTYDDAVSKLDTYYVYDDFGNLSYVLSPKMNATTSSISVINSQIKHLGYKYIYDYRNRLVKKRIPGKGEEVIVYDKLDRPVMTQDTILKPQKKWLFTKYDQLGRVVYTGIHTHGTVVSVESMQNTFDNTNNLPSKLYELKLSTTNPTDPYNIDYSTSNFPNTNLEIHTVNYYDSYDFDRAGVALPQVLINNFYQKPLTQNVKGLSTGSKVFVLVENKWITSVTYYDEKARPIYMYSYNDFLKTTDVIESNLDDFTGRLLETRTLHTNTNDTNLATQTIIDKYEYDRLGKITKHSQKINTAPLYEVIAENTYDDLGQLTSKGVGGKTNQTRLQNVDYKYNIRGWLKNINDTENLGADLFSFKLNYNTTDITGSTPLFNGNISETLWYTANDATNNSVFKRGYNYQYDALNRIKLATKQVKTGFNSTFSHTYGSHSLEYINYDKNGNILELNRGSQSAYLGMDKLVYTYDTGNKLLKVVDNETSTFKSEGFKDGINSGNDYTYDDNGNILTDLNKGIATNIIYNHLNLPRQVTINGQNIIYTYDASGAKHRKVAQGITIDYAGNYIYENNTLQFFNHAEGYVKNDNGVFNYVYQYKDHLGNVRVSYTDAAKTYQKIIDSDFENSLGGWLENGYINPSFENGRLKANVQQDWEGIRYNYTGVIPGQLYTVKIKFDKGNTQSNVRFYVSYDNTSGNHAGYHMFNGNLQTGEYTFTYTPVSNTGNIRIHLDKDNTNTSTETQFYVDYITFTKGKLEIIEESNYYPFGLKHKGYNEFYNTGAGNPTAQKWKYNGVEYNESLGLNLYEMDFRMYDPAIARFNGIDPVTHYSQGTSVAFDNNPIYWADPSGADSKTLQDFNGNLWTVDCENGSCGNEKKIPKEGESKTIEVSVVNGLDGDTRTYQETVYYHSGGLNGSKPGWKSSKEYAKLIQPVAIALAGGHSPYGTIEWFNNVDSANGYKELVLGFSSSIRSEVAMQNHFMKTGQIDTDDLSTIAIFIPLIKSFSALNIANKGVGSFFQGGRIAKASELVGYAEQQGWKAMQSAGGPLKYVDESGVIRMTIKQGSQRAAGSGFPHVELRNAHGKRIDAFGNEVTRKGLGNHTEIIYDLK